MNNPQLDQAREYAQWMIDNTPRHHQSKARAAAEVIQSLPDHIIDAEKVRELIGDMKNFIEGDAPENPWGEGFDSATWRWVEKLEALLPTPSLPTLAELIEQGNDPQQYQWMQCNVEDRGDDTFVIASVRELVTKVLLPDGMHEVKGNSQVTPLLDLPRLEWPAQDTAQFVKSLPDEWIDAEKVREILAEQYMKIEGSDTKWINAATIESLLPPPPPRPEDVPAGEPWLVKCDGHEWVGTRESRVETVCSWTLARLDGADYTVARDDEITLVSRLVPERKENA